MEIGIVGLPSAGKSTLFNAITKAGAQIGNFPFTTIDKNVGIAAVPDQRLDLLSELFKPEKTTPATIKFIDIAGLVKGASKGEGLGNMFLSHIREIDVIVHVVRAFEDGNVSHVNGTVEPANDIETINTELQLADIQSIERREEKVAKEKKADPKDAALERELLGEVKGILNEGKHARSYKHIDKLAHLSLLTAKPVIYVANVDESHINEANERLDAIKAIAVQENTMVIAISAKIEAELAELDPGEVDEFLNDVGIDEPGLNKLIRSAYKLLGLITFFTAGEKECRAWSIKDGSTAPKAAAEIHTDFERGFIKAEVIEVDRLLNAGSIAKAKELGELRIEGKDYIVKDGDCITFRFNV